MYRGSSFLLQKAYTVHDDAIRVLASDEFEKLWGIDFGAFETDKELIPLVCGLQEALYKVYRREVDQKNSAQPTDTLLTKIILGTLGILPAYDRYFLDGLKQEDGTRGCMRPNEKSINWLLAFVESNRAELQDAQEAIGRTHYPLMKLIDMHFWETGYAIDLNRSKGKTTR
jgi:hypothetical protein